MSITNLISASRTLQHILYVLPILWAIQCVIICECVIPHAYGDYKRLGALIVEIQIS